jgi:hypothetical protein
VAGLTITIAEANVECARGVLPQLVRRSHLQRLRIIPSHDHEISAPANSRAWSCVLGRRGSPAPRPSRPRTRRRGPQRVFARRVHGVALLPEELRGTQQQPPSPAAVGVSSNPASTGSSSATKGQCRSGLGAIPHDGPTSRASTSFGQWTGSLVRRPTAPDVAAGYKQRQWSSSPTRKRARGRVGVESPGRGVGCLRGTACQC